MSTFLAKRALRQAEQPREGLDSRRRTRRQRLRFCDNISASCAGDEAQTPRVRVHFEVTCVDYYEATLPVSDIFQTHEGAVAAVKRFVLDQIGRYLLRHRDDAALAERYLCVALNHADDEDDEDALMPDSYMVERNFKVLAALAQKDSPDGSDVFSCRIHVKQTYQ